VVRREKNCPIPRALKISVPVRHCLIDGQIVTGYAS
jgi:hypothetical protein